MWDLNYDSISEIDAILKENGLAMSKKFGQNFLISRQGRERIVDLMKLDSSMKVWEIGPGLGAITHLVLGKKAELTCFEIDHGFAEILRDKAFCDEPLFELVEGDALKTLFRYNHTPDRIIGNLPYNVGSVIIARLIERSILPEMMVFTLQKEVVERMCASTGSDSYSSFSVLTQIDYENKLALTLKKGCFWPQPQVDSAVVVMTKRKEPLVPEELRDTFIPLVRDLFSQRRKTIKNNLISSKYGNLGKDAIESIISSASLSGSERAESLSFSQLLSLAKSAREYYTIG